VSMRRTMRAPSRCPGAGQRENARHRHLLRSYSSASCGKTQQKEDAHGIRLRDRGRRLRRRDAGLPPQRRPRRDGLPDRSRRRRPRHPGAGTRRHRGDAAGTPAHQQLRLQDRAAARPRRTPRLPAARARASADRARSTRCSTCAAIATTTTTGRAPAARAGRSTRCCRTSSAPRATSAAKARCTAPTGRCRSPSSRARGRSPKTSCGRLQSAAFRATTISTVPSRKARASTRSRSSTAARRTASAARPPRRTCIR
jgi:hypothetical protein